MKPPKRPTQARPPQYGYYQQPRQPRWHPPKPKSKIPWYVWVIIGVVVISLLGAIGSTAKKDTETPAATATAVQAAVTAPTATSAPATSTAGPTAAPKPTQPAAAATTATVAPTFAPTATQPPAPTALTDEPVASVVARLQAGQCVAADWFSYKNVATSSIDGSINPQLRTLDKKTVCIEGLVDEALFDNFSNTLYFKALYMAIPEGSNFPVYVDETAIRSNSSGPAQNESKFKTFQVKKGDRVKVTGRLNTNLTIDLRITDPQQLVVIK